MAPIRDLCRACNKNFQTDPEMESICDPCWAILNAYDFLVWARQAKKKGSKLDRKRLKDSFRLITDESVQLRKMLADFRPGQKVEGFPTGI